MKTIGQRLNDTGNIGPGFDLVRIVLSFGVLAWHAVAIVDGTAENAKDSFFWPYAFAILPMFFALSGFLVTGSALRLPLREYILNRTFRILPALAVDVVFAALILGPVISTVAAVDYFSDNLLYKYFLNIIGWIHYQLPGVFQGNPNSAIVNGALWTVPFEIACYVIMSFMISIGIVRSWKYTVGLVVILTFGAIIMYSSGFHSGYKGIDAVLTHVFLSKGASLIPCFLAGAAIYLAKDFLPWSWRWAAAIALALVCCSLFAPSYWFDNPVFIAVSVFPLSYLVVWLGLARLPKLPIFNRGDYSYGIYLYHYPILQLLQMQIGFTVWWTLFIAGLLPVTIFAMFSWHNIEKPILKQRRRFSLIGARIMLDDESRASVLGSVNRPVGPSPIKP